MAASRNGYDILSQHYFRDLGACLGEEIDPARHQSISDARAKLRWQALEYLLEQSYFESSGLPPGQRFKGHITRAIDDMSFLTPRTDELLGRFSFLLICLWCSARFTDHPSLGSHLAHSVRRGRGFYTH